MLVVVVTLVPPHLGKELFALRTCDTKLLLCWSSKHAAVPETTYGSVCRRVKGNNPKRLLAVRDRLVPGRCCYNSQK